MAEPKPCIYHFIDDGQVDVMESKDQADQRKIGTFVSHVRKRFPDFLAGDNIKLLGLLQKTLKKNKFRALTLYFNPDGSWNYALCVKPDQFARKIGVAIAGGRLRKHGQATRF